MEPKSTADAKQSREHAGSGEHGQRGGRPQHNHGGPPASRPAALGEVHRDTKRTASLAAGRPQGATGGPQLQGRTRGAAAQSAARSAVARGNGRGLGVGARQRWWGATLTQGAWRPQCAGLGRPGIHPLVCAAIRHRTCGMSHGSTVVRRSRICPGGHAKVDPGREGCPRSRGSTRRNSWRRREPSRRSRASLRSVCCAALAMCPHR